MDPAIFLSASPLDFSSDFYTTLRSVQPRHINWGDIIGVSGNAYLYCRLWLLNRKIIKAARTHNYGAQSLDEFQKLLGCGKERTTRVLFLEHLWVCDERRRRPSLCVKNVVSHKCSHLGGGGPGHPAAVSYEEREIISRLFLCHNQ